MVKRELDKSCATGNRTCENQRLLFLDIVAHRGDDFSQDFIIRKYLTNNTANSLDIERVLVHTVGIKKPELVSILQNFYFLCLEGPKTYSSWIICLFVCLLFHLPVGLEFRPTYI